MIATTGRRLLTACLVGGCLLPIQAGAQTPVEGWSGRIQCLIASRGVGYEDDQTHTWVVSGPPAVRNDFRDYPATWTVSGHGRRTPVSARAAAAGVGDTWTYDGSDASASITMFVPVGTGTIRIAGGQRAVKAAGGLKGTTASTPFATDVGEWRFLFIDVIDGAGRAALSDSRMQTRSDLAGWRPPAGTTVTETCSWNMTRNVPGSAGGADAKAVVAGAGATAGGAARAPATSGGAAPAGATASGSAAGVAPSSAAGGASPASGGTSGAGSARASVMAGGAAPAAGATASGSAAAAADSGAAGAARPAAGGGVAGAVSTAAGAGAAGGAAASPSGASAKPPAGAAEIGAAGAAAAGNAASSTTATGIANAASSADVARQYAVIGLTPTPGTGIVVATLVDDTGAPLVGVSVADIRLLDATSLPVGLGPYMFGATGDIVDSSTLAVTTSVGGRSRVAFLDVPVGTLTLTVVYSRDGKVLTRSAPVVTAAGGMTTVQP
jgi:hypothetical protein